MLIVDTGTWADYFNEAERPHAARLDHALRDEEDLAIVPIILAEVLQGFRTDRGFRRARELLLRLPVLEPPVDTHVRAARLFRRLRRKGVTVRRSTA